MTVQEALDCLGNTSRAASALEEALVSLQEIEDAGATLAGELIIRCLNTFEKIFGRSLFK